MNLFSNGVHVIFGISLHGEASLFKKKIYSLEIMLVKAALLKIRT